jgi:uncharacterized protein (TIGR00255 family)
MTGFARAEGSDGTQAWTWEARSVNGKGLDVRCRLPAGYDELDARARETAGSRFRRGNVSLTLSLDKSQGVSPLKVNREALAAVLDVARELSVSENLAPPSVDGLLRLPGVLETDTSEEPDTREARVIAMGQTLDTLLDMLAETRGREGRQLQAILEGQLDDITDGIVGAENHEASQPQAIRDRLREQVGALLDADTPLPEERLAQEIAMLTVKADIREELDRLRTHVGAFRDLLAKGDAPGRQLGFLCQELLREANTLCSKSSDTGLTAIGLDLKVAIDRLREQVLNVE